MAILKCKICGGDIDVSPDRTLGTCQYCGTTMTIPVIDSDKKARLYNRAIQYLNHCDFDKAYSAYENIVSDEENEAEAYWGMLLAEYGIEYVEDPVEKKRIPTCHRTKNLSPRKIINYDLAIKNASDEQKEMYIQEAVEIERLQNNIKSISSKEKPYDVFICYKYSDENGDPTEDSAIAHEIYDSLEQSGLRVFFSKITLEDKLGTEYEPYIYAALRSAKLLLLVTTKKEYCETVWVRNEWSRFLDFMKDDKSKRIIPVYKNISAGDLPEDLQKFQGLDLSKLGALQDLKHVVKKQIDWSKENTPKFDLGKLNIKKEYLKWAAIAAGGVGIAVAVILIVLMLIRGHGEEPPVAETADAVVNNEMVIGKENESEAAVETEEALSVESHKDDLIAYAKQIEYVNGLTGGYTLTNFYKDLSKIPIGSIDCFIDDFDGDGDDELLIPSIDANQVITLTMYEYNGKVKVADRYEYRVNPLAADKGVTTAFSYDYSGEKYIGLFTDDLYYLTADGLSLAFAAVVYDGQEFLIKGFTDYAGSDGEEDRNFTKTLKNCGLKIEWDKLFSDTAWRDVLSVSGGERMFDIYTRTNEPANYMTYDTVLNGYVSYTGYSSNDFTYNEGGDPASAWQDTQNENEEDEYLIPYSADRYLTEADLAGFSNDELRKARNEIAARHGRRFKDEELQSYFDSKSWYYGTIEADEFNKVVRLTDIEQKNMEFIKKHEK